MTLGLFVGVPRLDVWLVFQGWVSFVSVGLLSSRDYMFVFFLSVSFFGEGIFLWV